MIYIGSDHGGFKLKERLVKFLKKNKIEFSDLGAEGFVATDDYPIYVKKVCTNVLKNLGTNKGILICKSGHGVSIAANKYKGIRAALCWNTKVANHSRRDDDANVLCLPSEFVLGSEAEQITLEWLNTPFSFEKRHIRRLKQIEK
ncbi:MAG: hypothetical protein JWO40_429 [Candidatus Doudnabacteria bacterium]|nr:hypothetical protein [Candidatus Doudnabacteria bacterium]